VSAGFKVSRIAGVRTVLRPIKMADVDHMTRWLNDPRVMPYWGGLSETRTRAQTVKWVRRFVTGKGPGLACVVIQEDNTPVGFIEMAYDAGDANYGHKVEVDICIGEPARWDSGLGTDAMTALLRWLFTSTDIVRVFLQPRVVNARAVHVYEKVGFKREGIIKKGEKVDGVLYDCAMMAALRDEWLAEFGR